jgi:putative hydrolase of the HAD superfamily
MSRNDQRPSEPRLDHVEVWVFDLDNTLYSAQHDLFAQVDQRMGEFVATLLDMGFEDARVVQKSLFRQHGSTMRGLMTEHGIDPNAFLDYVHDIDVSVLPQDEALDRALARLEGRKFVFTSASADHAERVMARIGVHHHFDDIFDVVAADYLPKPHPPTYRRFVERHQVEPGKAAMFEDIARNLAPAAALGMTTVWVPGLTEWSREGSDGDHIHYVAEDLTEWLTELTAR